jgi:hypothetical protein
LVTQRKYQKLGKEVETAMPILIKHDNPNQMRKLMDILRRYLPKHFFKIIQKINKNSKRSMIAISFKDKVVDGKICPEVSIPEYLTDLYKNEIPLDWPIIQSGKYIHITLKHLHRAKQKLSFNKAPGTDLMMDSFLKNRKIFDGIKHKLREHFEKWINQGRVPEFMRIGKVFILSKEENTAHPTKPAIRSIMVQNMITKLFEITLQQLMEKEDARLGLIQPC